MKKQIARCQSLLEASRTWTNFEAAPFREALSCSLELLGAEPLIETTDEEGARVWTFPPLGLMKLAEEMLASSALLMKAAHKIPHREKRQCMEINSYIKQGHVCADEVRRIAKPLLDLEADKRAARPDQANVVEGKFPAAAASS